MASKTRSVDDDDDVDVMEIDLDKTSNVRVVVVDALVVVVSPTMGNREVDGNDSVAVAVGGTIAAKADLARRRVADSIGWRPVLTNVANV